MSELLHFSEHHLQEGALLFMAIVYTLRVRWLLRFKAGKERQAATGLGDTNPRKGFIYSWANVAMPWTMSLVTRFGRLTPMKSSRPAIASASVPLMLSLLVRPASASFSSFMFCSRPR